MIKINQMNTHMITPYLVEMKIINPTSLGFIFNLTPFVKWRVTSLIMKVILHSYFPKSYKIGPPLLCNVYI